VISGQTPARSATSPCGIYDPEQARIEAESCYKIIGMYHDSDDPNLKARIIHVQEERAELVKHHLDVLWHDYFKLEHLQQYPDLHETFSKATKQASTVRHPLDLDAARELLSMIDTIDEFRWRDDLPELVPAGSGQVCTTRATVPGAGWP
jgi:nickel superoxide dismutase